MVEVNPAGHMNIMELPLDGYRQVSVESVEMKLRVGEKKDFTVSVGSADNFPLDLYLLMDFSKSFDDDLESARNTAGDIVSALENITSQFRVGFGKFTDKPTPPYTSYTQLDLAYMINGEKSSCRYSPGVTTKPCGRPIPFEHVVTLTNSSMDFSSAIQSLAIEVSADDPEGILDSMMQAAVCTDIVGWRKEARKVLLVMTDALAHTAGDGRLAAIHTPNDGRCHTHYNPQLNKTVYTGSLDYDYPSLEHMRLVLLENGIVPVFAVSSIEALGSKDYYQYFANTMEGFCINLADDSSNIVEVILEAYNKIASNVSLVYDAPAFLTISHMAECPTNALIDNSCTNIGNKSANFTISLTLNECPGQNFTSEVKFRLPGFGNFMVNVEGICDCSCEQHTKQNSPNCSGNGAITCGKCSCFDGWEGEDCSCSTKPCPVGPNGKTCSGEGSCVCGKCQCDPVTASYAGVVGPMVFGSACECSNFRCDRDGRGVICSGRGTCQCKGEESHCECDVSTMTGLQHTGDHCQCSHDHCINPKEPGSGICSGRGSCDPCHPRGSGCTCSSGYGAEYCQSMIFQDSANCNSENDTVQQCVLCLGKSSTSDFPSTTCPQCSTGEFEVFESVQPNDYNIPKAVEDTTVNCAIQDGTTCVYYYFAGIGSTGETIYAVEPRKCVVLPLWGMVTVISVGLLALGIIIIAMVRLTLCYLDYREAKTLKKKFLIDRTPKLDHVLYEPAVEVHSNVAYGQTHMFLSKSSAKLEDRMYESATAVYEVVACDRM